MRLDRLAKSQKTPDRWYAEFSDGERYAVNTALIADFSLYTGRELDDAEYEAFKNSAKTQASRARALRILGNRCMSRREMLDRLKRKGETDETAEDAVAWLERAGLLNDAEYAPMLARHCAEKGYGRMRVRDELWKRGVPRELWDAALESIPWQDGAIDALLERRLRGKTPDRAELKRASDALLRRGFSWEEIKSALRRYGEAGEELDE